MVTRYFVQGMHCQACVDKITQALKEYDVHVQVTLDPPSIQFSSAPLLTEESLNTLLSQVGPYTVTLSQTKGIFEKVRLWLLTYKPLLLIVGVLSFASVKGGVSFWMTHFMAGFFIVFGTFKLFDLKGFQEAYATYDLLAKRVPFYGYLYPFLELILGFMYLYDWQIKAALWATVALMAFGSVGVMKALLDKKILRCACLGTSLNLPMSTLTVVEDVGMALMAFWMLIG